MSLWLEPDPDTLKIKPQNLDPKQGSLATRSLPTILQASAAGPSLLATTAINFDACYLGPATSSSPLPTPDE